MTGFFPPGQGNSPFDQFLSQFFGQAAPGRRGYSVDVSRLLTDQARGLVAEAADRAGAEARRRRRGQGRRAHRTRPRRARYRVLRHAWHRTSL
ncbi:predicted protein [Streptomyces sp. AA4]|nr:predicted protein [Streptomyces sp. AA4]